MMKFIKKLLSFQFIRFALVGGINTLIGLGLSLLAVNVFNWSQWLATAFGYTLGSITSFFLNRYFTFNYKKRDAAQIARFAVVIIVCYFISNIVAEPLVTQLLSGKDLSEKWVVNIATITANVIFVIFNYCGQKFFAFKKETKAPESEGKSDV